MPKPIQSIGRYLSGLERLRARGVEFKLVELSNGIKVPMSVEYPNAFPAVTLWYHFFGSPMASSDSHAFALWGIKRSLYLRIDAATFAKPNHSRKLRAAILEALDLHE